MKGEKVYCIIKKNKKGNVVYSSGRITFYSGGEELILNSMDRLGYEIIEITNIQMPPQEKYVGTYCPYCGTTSMWKTDADIGYKKCPVCDISDADYWVKKYNNLWNVGIKMKRGRNNAKSK